MENSFSSSSSNSSRNASPTQTVIITPSQLEKMGLIVRMKDSDDDQTEKEIENKSEKTIPSEDKKDLKIDPKRMKNKLCTLLNHTPLVMQVKDVDWVARDTKNQPPLNQKINIEPVPSDDQDEGPKFKIVSDEKSNLSASEIENMLSSAKVIKSDDAISSPLQKNRIEEVVKSNKNSNVSEVKDSQSTSKKECLKRIQAKMYENLKKVLDEVDSFPVRDRAYLTVKPVANAEDAKAMPVKQDAGRVTEKPKENKPCYMSTYRERKMSQDVEKATEDVKSNNEVIKIDDESDEVVKIPKKRKRPPIDAVDVYQLTDEGPETVIEIADGPEEVKKDNRPHKKSIIKQFYRNVKAQTPQSENKVVKTSAKMINTSKASPIVTPKKRGRPRKIRTVETINIIVEHIDSEPEKESNEDVPKKAEISVGNSDETPRRKRGRPKKIRTLDGTSPRKRGRPPKFRHNLPESSGESSNHKSKPSVSKTEESNEDLDISTQSESQSNNAPVEVRPFKKRGRKSKAELAALRKTEPEKYDVKEKYTESRTSGRKRKVVDYHMLNGDDSDMEELEVKVQRDSSSYGNRKAKTNRGRGQTPNDEYGSSKAKVKRHAKSESSEETDEDDEELEKDESEDDEEIADESGDAKRTTEKKSRKPEDTDKTDDRLKQPDEDAASPREEELESEDVPNRETKLKDDEVRCAICEEIVQENLWSQHKRKAHNDLAWFAGEQSLNLEDTAFVEEKLNAILKEDGILKCVTCGIQTDSAESFVQHKKNCTVRLDNKKKINKTDTKIKGKKNVKPGGTAEVLNFLLTSFAKNLKDEPSETKFADDDGDDDYDDDNDNSVSQEDHPELQKNQTRCAVCMKVLLKVHWFNHKLSVHNNLAWRVGDTPLDLNDKSMVIRILNELYMKKKPLYCDVCGGTRKSVMGFLSHKSQCSKSSEEIADLKVRCHLCKRKMLPVSMSRHMILSHSDDVPLLDTEQENSEDQEDAGGRRKAANKASELIRNIKDESSAKIKFILKNVQFRSADEAITKFNEDVQKRGGTSCVFENCDYTVNEVEDLLQHMEVCSERCTNGYTCNFCLDTFQYKRSAREHLAIEHQHDGKEDLIIHDVSSGEDVFVECEDDTAVDDNIICEERGFRTKRRTQQEQNIIKFLGNCRKKMVNSCYRNVYKWTLDYHKQNYTTEGLFSHIVFDQSIWKQLDDSRLLEYLPKLKRSLDTATLKLNHVNIPCKLNYQWTSFKLFQSAIDVDGTTTIFCGGPISSMAWAPIPHNQRGMDQILAISVLPDPNKMYYGTRVDRDKGMIQFWNHGALDNKEKPGDKPHLEYCLVHNYGIVWCMEWCPSGCYDNEEIKPFRRLGLLAMACSDSNVYIYTVPKPRQFSGKIFQSSPTFKFIVDSIDLDLGESSYHATKISWSKASGHSYVAVGYSNGVIGIFNLNTKSELLRQDLDGVVVLKPIHAFRAHNDAVTALALHHLDEGNRWLMSGSLDRECKLWDLKNMPEPVSTIKKHIITDGVWMMHWLCPIYTFDHSTIFGAVSSGLIPARNYNGTMTTFLPTNSRATSISSSEWGNLFVQGNDCGEVVCGFPDQLLYGFDNDKRRMIRRCRTLASYTAYVAKKLTPEERLSKEELKMDIRNKKKEWSDVDGVDLSEPRTYNEVCDSFGLVFCDMNKNEPENNPTLELDKLIQSQPFHSISKPNMYPVQSINRIALNPNKNAYLFYSCGYQVGFVRTSSLRFLNN